MSNEPTGNPTETGRVEAFSDGVFAIAVTLLVLDLKVPAASPHGPRLGLLLLRQWPSYLTSFAGFRRRRERGKTGNLLEKLPLARGAP